MIPRPASDAGAGRFRRSAVALVVALLVGACAGEPAPVSSSEATQRALPQDGGETSSSAPDVSSEDVAARPADYTIDGCDDPTETFALLCEAHDLIRERHVEAPTDAILARSATEGVEPDPSGTPPADFTCQVPTEAFAVLCDALAVADDVDAATIQAAVRAMVAGSLDPYSAYQDPQERERARASLDGSVEGIGALVTSEQLTAPDEQTDGEGETCTELSATCAVVIVSVFDDSPAQRGGLQDGDRIVAVDGKPVDGDTLGGVVERVRGPAGSEVELGIQRDGKLRTLRLTRASVDIPVLETAEVGDIAYLRLGLFTSHADEAVRDALADLLDARTEAVVLDLRANPGGSLDTAIGVASQFLASGDVVRTRSPEAERSYRVERGGLATDPSLELYVVVDDASASASEVVAGALQEAGRATIVGQRTFGKDTVQQTFDLDDGGALKLTIARWLTPGGRGLDAGVAPDVTLELEAAGTPEAVVDAVTDAVEAGP